MQVKVPLEGSPLCLQPVVCETCSRRSRFLRRFAKKLSNEIWQTCSNYLRGIVNYISDRSPQEGRAVWDLFALLSVNFFAWGCS